MLKKDRTLFGTKILNLKINSKLEYYSNEAKK